MKSGVRRIQARDPPDPELPPQVLPGESHHVRPQAEPHQVHLGDGELAAVVVRFEEPRQVPRHELHVLHGVEVPQSAGQLRPVDEDDVRGDVSPEVS